jgi:uncharacterized protein (TIGR03067 family)
VTLAVLLAAVAFAAGGAAAELDGSWTVARVVFEGVPRAEKKLLNATWTFRGSELLAQNANGERFRAALSFDSTAQPPAVYVVPIDDAQQRPLWMIWARQGNELRVAFFDGVDARPVDFGPQRKLVVLTLVPARSAPVALDPCGSLRAADVDGLLGGPTQPGSARRAASEPGSTCALNRTDGSRAISLTLVPAPAGAGYIDAARREAQSSRMQIQDEPALGVGAFSSTSGSRVIVVAERRGAAIVLELEGFGVDRTQLRRFAARVLDSL